jgi:hypothetical protein
LHLSQNSFLIFRLVEQGMKDTNRYVLKQHAQMLDYRRKEASLLSQTREVKRLSDLIMLELRVSAHFTQSAQNVYSLGNIKMAVW